MMESRIVRMEFKPRLPGELVDPVRPFSEDQFGASWDTSFEDSVDELLDLCVKLCELSPDPTNSPLERLERVAKIVPESEMMTEHRKSARNKLKLLRRRLDELVPHLVGESRAQLAWLEERVHQVIPGPESTHEKLEMVEDRRDTDVGVSPRVWQ